MKNPLNSFLMIDQEEIMKRSWQNGRFLLSDYCKMTRHFRRALTNTINFKTSNTKSTRFLVLSGSAKRETENMTSMKRTCKYTSHVRKRVKIFNKSFTDEWLTSMDGSDGSVKYESPQGHSMSAAPAGR